MPFKIGCLGKITSFIETDDKRFLIGQGIVRFEIEKEVETNKNIENVKSRMKVFMRI